MPRLEENRQLEKKMLSYVHFPVGLPVIVRGYWTEHSERAVLPTGLSLKPIPLADRDMLGMWKPEGSDTYMKAYGGRVARLQAINARFGEIDRAGRGAFNPKPETPEPYIFIPGPKPLS